MEANLFLLIGAGVPTRLAIAWAVVEAIQTISSRNHHTADDLALSDGLLGDEVLCSGGH